MIPTFELRRGSSPLLVSIPHDGRVVPEDIASRFTPKAAALPDTDWHVAQLYGFVDALDATVIIATHSRYVVDLNRSPGREPLYPGRFESTFVPTTTFEGDPIYADAEPTAEEVKERRHRYWEPYHQALAHELDRIKRRHGIACLWDAHSIKSRVPKLFDGSLPDLNLGTNEGRSCSKDRAAAVARVARASPYTWVEDGRFKGGYITRTYGAPDDVHAFQLELSQATYMGEAPPYPFDESRAARLRPLLKGMLTAFATPVK